MIGISAGMWRGYPGRKDTGHQQQGKYETITKENELRIMEVIMGWTESERAFIGARGN